jgi:sterol desaturase/sphingolipid hydroxylase (fatty acid hydroxylase superfamily)
MEQLFVGAKTYWGEPALYILILTAVNAIPVFALGLFAHYVMAESETNWFAKYRILPGKKSDPELTRKAIVQILITQFVGGPIILYLMYYFERGFNPTVMASEFPDLVTIAWQVAVCAIIEDTLLYWMHRVEHHPIFYQWVHKQHHEFHVSNSWASGYATAWEKLTVFIVPAVAGCWILRAHIVTHAVLTFILVLDGFVAHAGYDLPFVPFSSALRHNYHHSHNIGTYGLKFPFWDWLMGTDKHFKKWKVQYLKERAERLSSSTLSW